MFNPTKKIKLDPAWGKRYEISKIFVYLIFLAGMFWLGYLILFPSQYFSFSFLHPDSSKNNITDLTRIGNKLVFNAIAIGNFSKAKVKISLKKDSAPLEDNKISVRKSYQAFFYPIGEDISSSAGYSINSLISSGKSVFIAGQGEKFPVNNPRTFELSGFNWNNVESANGKDLSQYEKRDLFTICSAHPDGTVFLVQESGRYFYIQNGQKRELKGEALIVLNLQKKAVVAEEKGLEIKKECSFEKNLFFTNRYSCIIPISELDTLVGKDYQFKTDINSGAEIKKLSVVFQKAVNWKNFITSLSEIKSKIFLRYGLQ